MATGQKKVSFCLIQKEGNGKECSNYHAIALISHDVLCIDGITLMLESEEELKSFLLKVKEEGEKVGLKLTIQKAKIIASTHHFMANRWEINGNSDRLYFLGLQSHCRW